MALSQTRNPAYELFPFRFTRVPEEPETILAVTDVGEHVYIGEETLRELAAGRAVTNEDELLALRSHHFIAFEESATTLRQMAAKYRTKKSFLRHGPLLHILVITLRCDHSCAYCQVSRAPLGAEGFDMTLDTARQAIDRILEFPGPELTIEFQGGEPLLRFDLVREGTLYAESQAAALGKSVAFTIATTLHQASDEVLDFLAEHNFHISTSVDGPDDLHDSARLHPDGDAWEKTVRAVERARRRLGSGAVAATTTLTRPALVRIEQVVDSLVGLGFRSLFLRPLSPYGFALRSGRKLGYSAAEFHEAYERAIRHMLRLSAGGTDVRESYFSLAAASVMTPFSHGYVDLRSPAGAGLGALVYNYDGCVYPSDEARMLAAQGDPLFRLGRVDESAERLLNSDAMKLVLGASVAESIPGCADCAFLPFCGAEPIYHYATQGDPVGHRPTSEFCRRHLALFHLLFRLLRQGDAATAETLLSWAYAAR